MAHFPLHPLPAMVRAFHFLLRQGSAIARLAVHLAMVKAVGLVACRPETEKESPQAAAVFAAHFSPELDRFFSAAGLSDPCLVIADPWIVAGLSAAAQSGLPVAAGSAVVAVGLGLAAGSAAVGFVGSVVADLAFDPVCSVCPVCLFAVVTGKGTVAVAAFCF